MSYNINRQVAYGKSQGLIDIFNDPVVSLRSPLTSDKANIGQLWVNKLTNQVWMLTSFLNGFAIWTELDNTGNTTGLTWVTTAAPAFNMNPNTGYVLTNGGAVTLTLPLVSAVGDQFYIMGNNSSFTIAQNNPAQQITFGPRQTTAGAGGSVRSVVGHTGVVAHLITTAANTAFEIDYANDNLNLV